LRVESEVLRVESEVLRVESEVLRVESEVGWRTIFYFAPAFVVIPTAGRNPPPSCGSLC